MAIDASKRIMHPNSPNQSGATARNAMKIRRPVIDRHAHAIPAKKRADRFHPPLAASSSGTGACRAIGQRTMLPNWRGHEPINLPIFQVPLHGRYNDSFGGEPPSLDRFGSFEKY
nr:hypothetical protein [Burkholderia latens]